MFTGIIQCQGRIENVSDDQGGREMTIRGPEGYFSRTRVGDSIAHDGVCLTATEINNDTITVFAMVETCSKTTLGSLSQGDYVNLEQPLAVGDPLGGHIVQGHVDCTTNIVDIDKKDDGSYYVTFSLPQEIARYVVDRGSICLNGVSLTVAKRSDDTFSVALIPETINVTTFGSMGVGDVVNVEIDCIARYVEQMLHHSDPELAEGEES